MFAALTNRSLAAVQLVKEFIGLHETLLADRDPAARQEMKIYSVSSCVTRLYGIFEHFVETQISDYLDVIPDLCAFQDLSELMRKEYRIGISHLLNRLDGPRYNHLNHGDLIRWYHEALAAQQPYRFVAEALTRHDENLRLSVLRDMLKRVQLDDLQGWITHHEAIQALYEDKMAISSLVESELKNFVELRNDAAHGSLSNLPGSETLQRYCIMVSALIEAISSYFYREVILWRDRVGKAKCLGEVIEVFERPRAFILALEPKFSVAINSSVHMVGRWSCTESAIDSIHLDDQAMDGVAALGARLEVGLVCSTLPKRKSMLYVDI